MTFDELVKQLEPSMAVPMYPKALLIDFMRKAYDEAFKTCAKARLNVTTISDCPIKDEQKIVELEQQIEKMKCCENCRHYFKDSEAGCKLPDDACFEMSAWECKE